MKFSDLYVALGFRDDKFKRGIKGAQKRTSVFSKQMSALGGTIAAAFATTQIIAFGKEVFRLGGKAEGVRKAFEALDKPNLLEDLQKATRGTVDDLTLMQKAVQAKNFKIPLEQLATYFEFATKRAIQTGESVDYLVESIITGIGRKSVLVMDNLGISAVALQEEVKKVGDFGLAAGNIIQSELETMGDVTDTATTKVEQLNTAWVNLKTEIGEKVAPVMADFFESLTSFINGVQDAEGGILAEAIKKDRKEIEALRDAYIEKGIETDKDKATQIAINALAEQYRKLILSEEDLSARIKLREQYQAILDFSDKINTSTAEYTKEQQKVIDKQNEINSKVAKEFEIRNSMALLDLVHEESTRSADIEAAGNKEFNFEEEQEDPFAYLSSEELKDKTEALEELGSVMQAVDGIVYDFSNQVVKSLDLAATGFEGFMSNLAETIMKLISMLLANSLANAIAGATNSGTATGPLAVISTPVFIATAITGVLAAFAAIPSFATGGFVPGNSFYGDNQLIRANSGELILNGQQQKNLFDMINSGGNNNGYPKEIMVRASGSDLIGVISNENKLRNN